MLLPTIPDHPKAYSLDAECNPKPLTEVEVEAQKSQKSDLATRCVDYLRSDNFSCDDLFDLYYANNQSFHLDPIVGSHACINARIMDPDQGIEKLQEKLSTYIQNKDDEFMLNLISEMRNKAAQCDRKPGTSFNADLKGAWRYQPTTSSTIVEWSKSHLPD